MRRTTGFTLIELLIVVAIIAILAAIAVPNFLEAQVRSKVSRSRADMRSIATAMEAYCVDAGHYPPYTGPGAPGVGEAHWRLNHLSTPVAYITSVPNDCFADRMKDPVGWQYHQDAYMYAELQDWGNARTFNEARARGQKWFLVGRGPNLVFDCHAEFGGVEGGETEYDATNGTRSRGDLERFGP